jgi:hypothetical protein
VTTRRLLFTLPGANRSLSHAAKLGFCAPGDDVVIVGSADHTSVGAGALAEVDCCVLLLARLTYRGTRRHGAGRYASDVDCSGAGRVDPYK